MAVSVECPLGHEGNAEVTAPLLGEGDIRMSDPCGACGGSLLASNLSEEDRAFMRTLSVGPSPMAVTKYLLAHPDGPSGRRATDGKSGDLILGKYRILRLLGTGGMAQVYLARQIGAGGFSRDVVVKRILPHLTTDEMFVQMFLDEARIAARVSHPNVVQIFEIAQHLDQYLIVMEYVAGADLAALLRLAKKLELQVPYPVVLHIVAEMCAGLYAAHSSQDLNGQVSPIIHRDVSPHNLLISGAGIVKLSDFGVARASGNRSTTPNSSVKGKPAYLAPEQFKNGQIDHRVDIFAAGLVLYESLTGERAFYYPDNRAASFNALVNAAAPSIATHRQDVPEQVQAVLEKALAKDPNERYMSALEYQRDLEKVISDHGAVVTAVEISRWFSELWGQGVNAGLVRDMRTPSALEAADSTISLRNAVRQ
jgi:serine/threonine protein kinase